MWSADFNGRHSVFNPQQRLLFPIRESSDRTKKSLLHALQYGNCTGITLLNPDDGGALQLVRQTLQAVYAKNSQLHRSDFAFVCTTGATWPMDTIQDRIRDILGYLHIEKLDVLLLSRPTILTTTPATITTSQQKAIVLHHWATMCAIKRRELVQNIGVSDFTIPEMEFLFTASPVTSDPPTVLSLDVRVAANHHIATKTDGAQIPSLAMRAMVSFAHGRRMDVLVRFPFHAVESNTNTQLTQWRQVAQTIAARQQTTGFDVAVVHEAETQPYHLERRDMKETTTLQTTTEIILRYLIQQGVIVIPIPDSGEDDGDDKFTEQETHDIFYNLAHPFSSLPAAHSPQLQYSRILTKDELRQIELALALVVSYPDLYSSSNVVLQ